MSYKLQKYNHFLSTSIDCRYLGCGKSQGPRHRSQTCRPWEHLLVVRRCESLKGTNSHYNGDDRELLSGHTVGDFDTLLPHVFNCGVALQLNNKIWQHTESHTLDVSFRLWNVMQCVLALIVPPSSINSKSKRHCHRNTCKHQLEKKQTSFHWGNVELSHFILILIHEYPFLWLFEVVTLSSICC